MSESNISKLIQSAPNVCGGRPRIAGTRIEVQTVMSLLHSGMPESKIIENYPQLTCHSIAAARLYTSLTAVELALNSAKETRDYCFDKKLTRFVYICDRHIRSLEETAKSLRDRLCGI